MKTLALISFFFLTAGLYAQKLYEVPELKISFYAPDDLDKYTEDNVLFVGFDNDYMAVEIEIFSWDEDSDVYEQGPKKSAEYQTKLMGFIDLKAGSELPFIPNSFYYEAVEDDDEVAPVFVFTAFAPDRAYVYEVQIYCYDGDVKRGKDILNSFKLMD